MMLGSKPVRPFLKGIGGKRQLVSELLESHLPKEYNTKHHSYYEPFLSKGALLFGFTV